MFEKVKNFAVSAKNKVAVASVSAMSALMTVGVGAFAQTSSTTIAPTIDLSSIDFSPLTKAISDAVPVALPVVVGVVGIRKAISFVMGLVRGA